MSYRILIALLLLGLPFCAQAQFTTEQKTILEDKCRKELDQLMTLAEKRHYEGFGKMMAYTGRDPNRNLMDRLNLYDPHEKLFAETTLNEFHHHLSKSALWHADNFRIVKGMEGHLFIFDLEFTYKKGKTKQFKLTFVELKDDILFCRADK